MNNEEKINEILKTFAKAIVPDYFINKEPKYFVTAKTEINQLIEQTEEETTQIFDGHTSADVLKRIANLK